MGLFGTKVEKAFAKCKKKSMGLVARYVDGNAGHDVQLIRYDRNKFIITGFAESLREDSLEVSIPALNMAVTSRVTHTSHDIRGQILYHLPLPEEIQPIRKRENRYFVYPHGMVVLAPEDDSIDSQIMSKDMDANDAVKGLKMYLWDVDKDGFETLNTTKYKFGVGDAFSGKIRVGKTEDLFTAEVTQLLEKPFQKSVVSIAAFKFKSPPKNMDQISKMAARIDCM